jgi:hypothetical protein
MLIILGNGSSLCLCGSQKMSKRQAHIQYSMRIFTPFFMKPCEVLSITRMTLHTSPNPLSLPLEHYGRRTFVPVKVTNPTSTYFTPYYMVEYPQLYFDYIRGCSLRYQYNEHGIMTQHVLKEDMRKYQLVKEIHVATIEAPVLQEKDVLFCSRLY